MTDTHTSIDHLRPYQKTLVTQKHVLAWKQILPHLSLGTINTLMDQFVEQGATPQQMDSLFVNVFEMGGRQKDYFSQTDA